MHDHDAAVPPWRDTWLRWIELALARGPDPAAGYFGPGGFARTVAHRLLGHLGRRDAEAGRLMVRFLQRFASGDLSAGVGLARSLPADELLDGLLPLVLDAAAARPAEPPVSAAHPLGDPASQRLIKLLPHLLPIESVPDGAWTRWESHPGLRGLARFLAVWAADSERQAKKLAASALGKALVPWLHARLEPGRDLHGFVTLGVRRGLLPAAALDRPPVEPPEALLASWAELRQLWERLELTLDELAEGGYLGELVAAAMGVVLETDTPRPVDFGSSGWASELQEWVEIHQARVGPDHVVPRTWRDARPHLPVSRLSVLGRPSTTDFYFLDPAVRTADGAVPVFLYLYEIPLGCEVVAPSLPAFLGHHVVQVWAKREGATGDVGHLALPDGVVVARQVSLEEVRARVEAAFAGAKEAV